MKSISNNYYALAVTSVFIQACSIILLKHATNYCEEMLCLPVVFFYLIVASSIFIRVILWNKALALSDLSNVYVFTSLNPLFIVILSVIFLGEDVNAITITGAMIVMFAIYKQQRGRKAS